MHPIDSCEACRQIYWACFCGDSPINGIVHRPEDTPPKPTRCRNEWHEPGRPDLPMEIRLIDTRICCKRHYHHVGDTCRHCGDHD